MIYRNKCFLVWRKLWFILCMITVLLIVICDVSSYQWLAPPPLPKLQPGTLIQQGRIHGYPSPVRGGGIIWTGAVRPKTAKTPKHVSVMDQWMDGWTDRPTKRIVKSRNTWLRPGGAAQVVVFFLVFIRGLQTILKNSPGEHHQQQTDIAGCRVEYQTIDD